MLPDTKGSDYRMHVAGTEGYVDLDMVEKSLKLTNPSGVETLGAGGWKGLNTLNPLNP